MTISKQRIAALENRLESRRIWSENETGFLAWLSTPSLIVVIRDAATVKAERRWLADHGKHAFVVDRGNIEMNRSTGWGWVTDESERERYVNRECESLQSLMTLYSLRDALQLWADETDGLVPYWHDTGYAALSGRLDRERDKMAVHRGGDHPLSAAWRRDHPAWRSGMTVEEYDAWEATRLA